MRKIRDVRSLLAQADPAQGQDFLLPDYDFADRPDDLGIALAHRPKPTGLTARRRFAVASAVVATLALAGGLAVAGPVGTGETPAFAATPPLLDLEYDTTAPPAADYLLRIAASIPIPPTSDEVLVDSITFVRTRAWALDMAMSESETVAAIVPYEQERWRAPDGSGLVRRTWMPPQFADERARHDWEQIAGHASSENDVIRYGPGEQATVTPEPPSADLAELTAQLYAHQPRENGPKSAVRAVADIYRDWVLPATVRAQALRFLAEEEALRYHGRVTDRAGREGVAVTAESAGETDMLILDPHTGAVLAHENIINRDVRLPVKTPAVFSYVLILDSRYVTSTPE